MRALVLGTKEVSFTAKDGSEIEGMTIYFSYGDPKVNGVAADKMFLRNEKLRGLEWSPKVGDEFQPLYNRYGKVDTVEVF